MSRTTELQPCKPRCRHATCELARAATHRINQAFRAAMRAIAQERGAHVHHADGTGSYDKNLHYNDGGDGA